jgi:hypothetical protein
MARASCHIADGEAAVPPLLKNLRVINLSSYIFIELVSNLIGCLLLFYARLNKSVSVPGKSDMMAVMTRNYHDVG